MDVALILLFFVTIALHLVAWDMAKRIDWDATDRWVDVSTLSLVSRVKMYLLAWNVFICCFKTLDYIKINKTFAVPVIIIGGMLKKLVSFFFIFVIFLVAFAAFNYVSYGMSGSGSAENNAGLGITMVQSFRGSLGDVDFDAAKDQDFGFSQVMTLLMSFLTVILVLNLLIAVMSEAYEDVKDTAEARWCYAQFVEMHKQREQKKAAKMHARKRSSLFGGGSSDKVAAAESGRGHR